MAITVNLYYTGVNGNAGKFVQEMETVAALRDKYDLHMKVERYVSDDSGVDERFIRK